MPTHQGAELGRQFPSEAVEAEHERAAEESCKRQGTGGDHED